MTGDIDRNKSRTTASCLCRSSPSWGSAALTVGEILALAPGSVIKLSRPLGEKIDINVAGVRFGSGELITNGRRIVGAHGRISRANAE